MKCFVLQVVLALVAMVASQGVQIVDENFEQAQVVDYNPDQDQVDENSFHYDLNDFVLDQAFARADLEPQVVEDNPGEDQLDVNSFHYDLNNFVLDQAFARAGVEFDNGDEIIDLEPAYIEQQDSPSFPKRYDHPSWR